MAFKLRLALLLLVKMTIFILQPHVPSIDNNLESVMKTEMTEEQIVKASIDPASVFPSPMAVVADVSLSRARKIEILKCWEYDAKEMQVAVEEGLAEGNSGALLDAVIAALHQLGAGPDLEHSPPTKQGGV